MKYSKEWFSQEEIKRLFHCPALSSRNLLLMKVSYYGGLRISEALKSKKEEYRNESYAYLLIREQKTDKINWEAQPIPETVFAEVMRYCNDNNIRTQDYIFQSNRNKPLSYNMAYKMVKKSCKQCRIDKSITTHSFRRSRATHLLDKGISIYKISNFLRHSNIKTTQLYLKLSKKRLSEEIAKADQDLLFEEI